MPHRGGRVHRRAVIGHPVVRSSAHPESDEVITRGIARRRERRDDGSAGRSGG
ncbi:hypothetical protein [Gordonia insulae]|uniref:Uncharacterized protein n=1 Tax=Gordonia insulae TaxID=2420509 RepID=A0A3G8JT90_9ACTN|nr:hypothetical protein [Gordonia insulae]AZG47370.1 hypothetical protein D7316_03979 [Gordonia insulae]